MDVTEQAGRLGERIRSDQHAGERIRGHQPERLIDSSRGQAQRRPRTLGPEMIHPTLKGSHKASRGWTTLSGLGCSAVVVPVAALRLPPATFEQAFSLQEIRVRVLVQAAPSPPLGAGLGFGEQLKWRRTERRYRHLAGGVFRCHDRP